MRSLLASTFLASSLLTTACASQVTEVALTNPSPRAIQPRPVDQVAVYVGRRPAEPHVDVAIIAPPDEAHAYSASLPTLVDAVRSEAAALGCDAVVLERGERVWGACIVFAEAPAGVGPTVSPAAGTSGAPVAAPAAPAAPATVMAAAPPAVAPAARSTVPVAGTPAAPVAPSRSPAAVLERVFPKLDRDGNGRLGPSELPPGSAPVVQKVDTNRDGWVTRHELRVFNAAQEQARVDAATPRTR